MKRTLISLAFVVAVCVGIVFAQTQVQTTLDDFFLAGSQPGQSGQLETPQRCDNCHGGYDQDVEPSFNWSGSMMAQAARDPFFYACMTIANQDAAFAGDLCIRCHSPAGWLEGRSIPTDGSALNNNDREGVQCDFCHKLVDPRVATSATNPYVLDGDYMSGTYPRDVAYFGTMTDIPGWNANGMYVVDSDNGKRGPFTDAVGRHQQWYSPFHSESAICGTCHDVSNPAFSRTTGVDPYGNPVYALNTVGARAPTMNPRQLFPVERTYSEWTQSDYATGETKVTCQDCHMRDVTGRGANKKNAPLRTDLPLHDMTGGNTWVPDILATFFPGEVDQQALAAGKQRAAAMLESAADLTAEIIGEDLHVKITNLTGHKLPSGYPEGRRIWLNVVFFDASDAVISEINGYDFTTAEFSTAATNTVDSDLIFETKLAMDEAVQAATGLSNSPKDGASFHFAVNNVIIKDNRIPPMGFNNVNFENVQAGHVPRGMYADDVYWYEEDFDLPLGYDHFLVRLYYQTASKDYVLFLRDENRTNNWGIDLYNAWLTSGKSAPVLMESVSSGGGGNDTEAPTVPTDLIAAAPKFNTVNLSWTPSIDNVGVAGYEVFRTDQGSTPIATITTTTYSDGSVAAGSTYTYYVRAFDAAFNYSANSATATVTTPAKKGKGGKNPKRGSGVIEEYVWLQATPTVAQHAVLVTCDMPHPGAVLLIVYNSVGQAVMQRRLEAAREGDLTHNLDVSGLAAGSYIIHASRSFGGRSFDAGTTRLIILR